MTVKSLYFPGNGLQAHHVLPQQFADKFSRVGLNINDPRFGAWVGPDHQRWSWAYNNEWTVFFLNNSNPTWNQVLSYARLLASKYGFSVNF